MIGNDRSQGNVNSFSLGAQVGGPDAAEATRNQEQKLRDAMNRWSGNYTSAIKEFAFLLRIDGAIHTYTQEWNILGAQKAKRKKNWIEVEIGVPKSAWQNQSDNYKNYLAAEVEKGLHYMVELLKQKKCDINDEALFADWKKIKNKYLGKIDLIH